MSKFNEQNINRKADQAWRNKDCEGKQCQFKKKLDEPLGEGLLRREKDNRDKREGSSSSSSSNQSPSRKLERERRRQLKLQQQQKQKERLNKAHETKQFEANKLDRERRI